MIQELFLSDFGLATVPEVCEWKGWAAKTVQNWVHAGLLPAVVLGTGRGSTFLVRRKDVEGFTPPPRGRPKAEEKPKGRAKKK